MSVKQGGNTIAGASTTDTANKNLSNLNSQGQNIANWSTNVANCITEIPQDIKLELNNGTLTLKAGSKVYVPNGAGVFDVVTLTADKTATQTVNDTRLYFYNGRYIEKFPVTQCHSGSTAPSGQTYMFWYDTTNNVVKKTSDSGSTWESGWSLPFCIATASSGAISSIDQVFNGFGYIGSTVFALPGVKGLIPNGRNEDGTLKNIEFTVSRVLTRTRDLTATNAPLVLNANDFANYAVADYNEELNLNIGSTGADTGRAIVGTWSATNGVITSFTPKTPFHAVDRNDSSWIAQQAMPSRRYITLTLGASGSSYTAPANGWFFIRRTSTAANQSLQITGKDAVQSWIYSSASSQLMAVYRPAKKGEIVAISYTLGSDKNQIFSFVYAEGDK